MPKKKQHQQPAQVAEIDQSLINRLLAAFEAAKAARAAGS